MAHVIPVPRAAAASAKVIDGSGAVVEVPCSPAVAAVLRDAGHPATEVPFTDLLPRTSRTHPDGRTLDPDGLGISTSVYTIAREACLARRKLDRPLWHYHDRHARPVEVLLGYQAMPADTGARPRELTVTWLRVRRDEARARAWLHPGRAAEPPLAPVEAPKVGVDGLAGGIGAVKVAAGVGMTRRERRAGKGTGTG